jgi:hypothetical protein
MFIIIIIIITIIIIMILSSLRGVVSLLGCGYGDDVGLSTGRDAVPEISTERIASYLRWHEGQVDGGEQSLFTRSEGNG